jgi:hypothetical protein
MPLIPSPSDGKTPSDGGRRISIIVFAVGMLTGLAYLGGPWFRPNIGFSEEEQIGRHLALGHGFVSPFIPTRFAPPTSWCPPVYPALIGIIYRHFGIRTHHAILTVVLFNLTCRAAAAAGLFWLGRQLLPARVGVFAAAIFLVDQTYWRVAALPWDNTLALALFLWLLALAIEIRQGNPSTPRSLLLGCGAGVLALTNAGYAPAILVILAIATMKPGTKPRWRIAAVATAAMILVLIPWTARNYARFHQLIFVRANAYTELWLGNLPGSSGWITPLNAKSHPSEDRAAFSLNVPGVSGVLNAKSHPSEDRAGHFQIIRLGEIAYFDLCRKRFWAEVDADPRAFWKCCANRVVYLILGDPTESGGTFGLFLGGLGLAGAWTAWRLGYPARSLLAAGIAAALPYIPTEVCNRYLLPGRAILTIFAAVALCEITRRVSSRSLSSP